ncbi:MAG: SPASM domain-containing protein [Candidatus Muirbacterium halophilum]|nr:SPASM domain-containing protein [Candidatus Muirbacterium halophilum]
MKWSKYNYVFKSDKFGFLLFNSFTNTFAELDESTYNEVIKIKENPNNYDFAKAPQLLLQFLSGKILLEDNEEPVMELHLKNTINRFSTPFLSLTIAPTRDCNFECPYCYEEDRPATYMTEEMEDKVINFTEKFKKVNAIHISWYGGEPLLCWDQIYRMSKKMKDKKIKFFSGIITNGYLLNKEVADQFTGARIHSAQITIDGLENTHNSRRKHKTKKDTFNVILKNIDYLLTVWKGSLSIRVNVDKTNHKEYNEVHQMINSRYKEYKDKISVYPGIVTDYSATCITADSCGMDQDAVTTFMFECYEKFKIKDLDFYPKSMYQACSANALHSYVIGPEGELYKCWRDLGKAEMIVGSVTGDIPVNNTLLAKYLVDITPYTSEKCKDCFFLPLCNGGCPNLRFSNKYLGTNFDTCLVQKNNIKKYLETHYEIKMVSDHKT